MSNFLKEEKQEIYKLLVESFDEGKEELIKEITDEVIATVSISENKEEIAEEINNLLKQRVNYYFENLISEEKNFITPKDIGEIEMIKVKKDIVKDTFTHDMIVGGATILGASVLGLLMKKLSGKTGGVAGALIGGFIGSAAGSGIGEDFIEKEYITREEINIDAVNEKIKKKLELILKNIIEKEEDLIIEKSNKFLQNNEEL